MARNFYRIFTENNPVMGVSKTFGIPEAKGLTKLVCFLNLNLQVTSYKQSTGFLGECETF